MKITLLHPSRGRAEKAKATFDYWIEKSSRLNEMEHIISIDSDELQIDQYKALFKKSIYCIYDNTDVVQATNRAAKHATGDILIYLSDDFKCPQNWDEEIVSRFMIKDNEEIKTPLLLKVDDCLQKFHIAVLTIPIMNIHLYKRLGYFWHPGYKSMFVDEDLYWTAKKIIG